MERRMIGNCRVRCEVGENPEIISKGYLSLLNSLFFGLAVRVTIAVSHKHTVINPFFYEYYHRKISEGKTKRQALKCVQRRLVNIIWTMLTRNEYYVNPPMHDLPMNPDA